MSRIASRSVTALAVLLLAGSCPLLAQATPGPGPWSDAHPLWFDLNGDGVPQAGELTGHARLTSTACTQVVEYPAGLGATESPCAEVYQDMGVGGSILRPSGLNQSLVSNSTGTFFEFLESVGPTPGANGTGQLLDTNGDGIFDALEVQGTGPVGPVPATRISLLPRDATGDGRPDYITVPWTTGGAGLLGVFTGTTPQIYVPLTDTNQDGWPDTITVQVANGGISTATGPPLSGAALVNGIPVPSATSIGLLVFAAALVTLGVKLLRGTAAAA